MVVEFAVWPALLAGLAGTAAMTAVMVMGRAVGMTDMDIMLITGGMMTGDERRARALGAVIHFVVMGTVVFGLLYAALFAWSDTAGVLTGLVFGFVHGLVVGALAMPMMSAIHPRMRAGHGGFTLPAPGIMGTGYGRGTPAGILLAHLVYGLVVALVYTALV
ncbi:DUF6789 family protein [Streptomyces radiopugnans]|uniref:DUF6789 family protein n=1 Tax=Streptomyces radiopugnans TaxID=403935 RepID=UPI003F1E4623